MSSILDSIYSTVAGGCNYVAATSSKKVWGPLAVLSSAAFYANHSTIGKVVAAAALVSVWLPNAPEGAKKAKSGPGLKFTIERASQLRVVGACVALAAPFALPSIVSKILETSHGQQMAQFCIGLYNRVAPAVVENAQHE